jgi:cytochrome c peroxidase
MHDGSILTLRDAVKHYASGGSVTESGPFAGDGRVSPLKSGLVRGFEITEAELDDVVAFLEALTDDAFVHDPAFASPFAQTARRAGWFRRFDSIIAARSARRLRGLAKP